MSSLTNKQIVEYLKKVEEESTEPIKYWTSNDTIVDKQAPSASEYQGDFFRAKTPEGLFLLYYRYMASKKGTKEFRDLTGVDYSSFEELSESIKDEAERHYFVFDKVKILNYF